jgi:hypothetical protein
VRDKLATLGFVIVGGTPQEADAYIRAGNEEVGRRGREIRTEAAMKIFDVHSHWGTKRGYPLQSEAELAKQKQVWNSEPRYHSEDEMADYFRAEGVKTILDFGFTKNSAARSGPRHARLRHGGAGQAFRRDPRALAADPSQGRRRRRQGIRARRKASKGFIGYLVSGPGCGKTADDPIYDLITISPKRRRGPCW